MLNLSSNDYLGLAADRQLKEEFPQTLTPATFLPTSSSSRLLPGNFGIYEELETELATLFGTETAPVSYTHLDVYKRQEHSTRQNQV